MEKQTITLDIDSNGNIFCLYTDEINLFAIGRVTNVRKASNVEFNEPSQLWEVKSLDGKVLYQNTNRNKALEFEIVQFSPGGKYYEEGTL